MTKHYQERIWEQLHGTPNKTCIEVAALMGLDQATVSHYLTQMFRRSMLDRKHRTWINEKARQQTSYEYTVRGNKYTLKPLALVSAKSVRKAPYQPPERPVEHPLFDAMVAHQNPTTSFDIEALTMRQARDLYNKLDAIFGGGK